MAERTPRICFQNSALSPRTTITASSQDPTRRATQLAKGSRGARARTALGWTINEAYNDSLLLHEANGGAIGTSLRIARVTPGYYATGDDMAAAVQTALAAATDFPIPYYQSASCLPPTLWLRGSHRGGRTYIVSIDGFAHPDWQGWDLSNLAGVVEVTNPPTYRTAQVNGEPAFEFDGTNDKFATTVNLSTLLGTNGVCTGFIVCRSEAAGGAVQDILRNATGNWRVYYDEASGEFRFTLNDGATRTVGKAGTQGAWHIITFTATGANILIGVDDADTAALATAAGGTANNTAEVLSIGGTGSNFLKGKIAEVLIFNSASSLTEEWRRRVHKYLSAKYGITDATTAPAWPNTYTVAYDATERHFTITRATGSVDFKLLADTDACSAHTSTVHHVSPYEPWGERIHRDLGYRDAQTAGSAQESDSATSHSIEWFELDLGAAACRVGIFAGVNDTLDFIVNVTTYQVTIAAGIYETPTELAAAVQEAMTDAVANIAVTWDTALNKLKVTNTTGNSMQLLFATGASTTPDGGATAHRTLGWSDENVTIANSASDTADNEVWGWNPTSTSVVIDHNSGGGGRYEIHASDVHNAGGVARGPNSTSWSLRGDERLRIAQRGLYAESPVDIGRRYLRLLIDDPENEDGFNELSIVYLGPYLALSQSFLQGYVHSNEPLSRTMRSEDGSFFLERRQPAHRFKGMLRQLPYSDRVALEFLEQVVGVGAGFFFLEDPQSKARIIDWTWYMVLASGFEFVQSVGDGVPPDRYETPVDLVEDLP